MPSAIGYPCRCRLCNGRKSLKHHPKNYVRVPSCPHCGANEKALREKYIEEGNIKKLKLDSVVWYFDKHRREKELVKRKETICKLDCLPYPHSIRSKECRHYEDWLLDSTANGSNAGKVLDNDQPMGF